MNERTRKMLIYLLFVVAVIWGIYSFPESKEQPVSEQVPVAVPASTPASAITTTATINVEEKKAETWGKDPFHSPRKVRNSIRRTASPRQWNLSGILYNQELPLAYINGKAVKAGDTIDNAKVIDIDRKKVTLEYRGDRFTVSMKKG